MVNLLTSYYYLSLFLTGIFGFFAISSKNPIHATFSLILCFIFASGSFILLGHEYIGVTLIIVYAGGLAIMLIFVLMFLDLKQLEAFQLNRSNTLSFFALLLATFILYLLFIILINSHFVSDNIDINNSINHPNFNLINTKFNQDSTTQTDYIDYSLFSSMIPSSSHIIIDQNDNNSVDVNNMKLNILLSHDFMYCVTQVGFFMYTLYRSHFILMSLLLLFAMVCAVFLTKEVRENIKLKSASNQAQVLIKKQESFKQLKRNPKKTFSLYSNRKK